MSRPPHIVEDDLRQIRRAIELAEEHAHQAWDREDAGDRRLKEVQRVMWDLELGDYPKNLPISREEAHKFAAILAEVLGEDLRDANLERSRRAPQPEEDPDRQAVIERGKSRRKALARGFVPTEEVLA